MSFARAGSAAGFWGGGAAGLAGGGAAEPVAPPARVAGFVAVPIDETSDQDLQVVEVHVQDARRGKPDCL